MDPLRAPCGLWIPLTPCAWEDLQRLAVLAGRRRGRAVSVAECLRGLLEEELPGCIREVRVLEAAPGEDRLGRAG